MSGGNRPYNFVLFHSLSQAVSGRRRTWRSGAARKAPTASCGRKFGSAPRIQKVQEASFFQEQSRDCLFLYVCYQKQNKTKPILPHRSLHGALFTLPLFLTAPRMVLPQDPSTAAFHHQAGAQQHAQPRHPCLDPQPCHSPRALPRAALERRRLLFRKARRRPSSCPVTASRRFDLERNRARKNRLAINVQRCGGAKQVELRAAFLSSCASGCS